MMKSQDEIKIGERMIDYMEGEIKSLSEHICMTKICDRNHFCSLNFKHITDHFSLTHGELCI